MSSFEKALVYHCSPTLCGLKPANLLSLSKDEYPHLPQLAAAYARLLEDKGIRLTILCSCGCRSCHRGNSGFHRWRNHSQRRRRL